MPLLARPRPSRIRGTLGVMERANERVRVLVTSQREPIVLSWDARQQLVRRLHDRAQRGAVECFTKVGASRLVRLGDEKAAVCATIDAWVRLENQPFAELPTGIYDLLCALELDLDRRDVRDAIAPQVQAPEPAKGTNDPPALDGQDQHVPRAALPEPPLEHDHRLPAEQIAPTDH